jgi:hypothetical protein
MTNQQIYTSLRNKGFRAVLLDNQNFVMVLPFKNRNINSVEVADALDIDSELCIREGETVLVYGVDS